MSETMRAAVFEGEGKLTLREAPIPTVQNPDDVLLKVEAASICGTDVHILHVPPGHPATAGAILGLSRGAELGFQAGKSANLRITRNAGPETARFVNTRVGTWVLPVVAASALGVAGFVVGSAVGHRGLVALSCLLGVGAEFSTTFFRPREARP